MGLSTVKELIAAPQNGGQGGKGDDAVWYYLTCSTCDVFCNSDGVPKNPTQGIEVKQWVRVGNRQPTPGNGTINLFAVNENGAKVSISAQSGGLGFLFIYANHVPSGTRAVEAALVVKGAEVHRISIPYRWDAEAPRSIVDFKTQSCACKYSTFAQADMSLDGWKWNAAAAPLSATYPYRFERNLIYFSDAPDTPLVGDPILVGSLGIDGVGSYMLNLSNDMDTVGLVMVDDEYFVDEGSYHLYTEFDLCGAKNAQIQSVGIYRGNVALLNHIAGGEESISENADLGISLFELRDGSINLYFDTEVPRVPGTRLELEIRANVQITEGGTTRNVSLSKVWPIRFEQQGKDGRSIVVFQLKPNQDFLIVNPNDNNPRPVPTQISCSVVRRFGESYRVLTDQEVQEAGLTISCDLGLGEPQNGNSFHIIPRSTECVCWILKNSNNEVIDREQIPIILNGKNGQPGESVQGERGPGIRGPLIWESCADDFYFENGGAGCSFHDIVYHNFQCYYCTVSHIKSSTPPNLDCGEDGHWQQGSMFQLVATMLFLAAKGKIANLQVDDINILYDGTSTEMFVADKSGLRMCNKDGVMVFSLDTNGNIEAQLLKVLNAVFENVEVKGNSSFSGLLKGVTGSFQTLQCVDRNGNISAVLKFGADGCLWVEDGDLVLQGTKDGRSVRLYTSDIWGRGSFGTWKRNILKVEGSYGYIYQDGLYSSGTRVNFTSGTYNNNTYYKIPGYDFGSYGFPIDTIVFNISEATTYRYELVLAASQRVMVVNGNDSRSNVRIYSNGNEVTWEGGELAEVINILPLMNPAPATGKPGRGLIIGAFRNNNW